MFEPLAPVRLSIGPAPMFMTPRQITSGLVPYPVLVTPYVPPTNKDLEILFQPMFDEYLEPPCVDRLVSLAPSILVLVNSADTPSSTTIDQDAPSLSHSPSSFVIKSPNSQQGVTAEYTIMEDNPLAPIDNDPFALMFLWTEVVTTACSTQNRSLIHTHHEKTPYELVHDKNPDLTFL
nr:putative ribonuclease H-like domain-containing protein [Tanacetum cinerariifolium]